MLAPGVGQRVGALVELLVGDVAALVADGHPVAVADRADGDRAGQHPVALEGQQHLGHAVGQLGTHHPAADADRREVGLVAEALGELEPAAHQRSRVEQSLQIDFYHWVLLTCDPQPTES